MAAGRRYAAFLRGMNLGNRRITNDELCAHFAELGYPDATAFLASGNVVFSAEDEDPDGLARRIEEGLREALGYEVPIFLRAADEVRALATSEPFSAQQLAASEGKLQVALLGAEPSTDDRATVLALCPDDEHLRFDGRQLYWLPATGVSGSDLDWKAVDRILGTVTIRTRRTLERIAAKYF